MGEHTGRYADTVDALVAAGLTVYAKRSSRARPLGPLAIGRICRGGFELLVQDMVRLSEIARAEDPDLPLLLWGTIWDPLRRRDTSSITATRLMV